MATAKPTTPAPGFGGEWDRVHEDQPAPDPNGLPPESKPAKKKTEGDK
jgi:hypothetical protein